MELSTIIAPIGQSLDNTVSIGTSPVGIQTETAPLLFV
jgi:hypothetical protein